MKTVFVFAMQDERASVTSRQEEVVYDDNVYYLKTGIGKVNAASSLTKFLENHDIDQIINIGLAGSVSNHDVLDVVIIKQAYFHDVDATLFGYPKYQVPGMPLTYESDPQLLETCKKISFQSIDTLYTGDQFITQKMPFEGVVDMEGASLYQVAYFYHKPIVSIKVVSDVIGKKSYQSFEMNQGSERIANIVKQLKEVL
ncbi:MAG: 5'-methylthioadenosine/S-adenosylhomocysteine nucleosidase [Firmicutes bacterium]|nr:5'-methylthioadenosine/S-adenosylhomocysteine nucleosidase [Bacillota bacterium]